LSQRIFRFNPYLSKKGKQKPLRKVRQHLPELSKTHNALKEMNPSIRISTIFPQATQPTTNARFAVQNHWKRQALIIIRVTALAFVSEFKTASRFDSKDADRKWLKCSDATPGRSFP
jgi:hypothetical protein